MQFPKAELPSMFLPGFMELQKGGQGAIDSVVVLVSWGNPRSGRFQLDKDTKTASRLRVFILGVAF